MLVVIRNLGRLDQTVMKSTSKRHNIFSLSVSTGFSTD